MNSGSVCWIIVYYGAKVKLWPSPGNTRNVKNTDWDYFGSKANALFQEPHTCSTCLSFSFSSGMKRLPYSEDEFGTPPNKLAKVDEPKRGVQHYFAVLSTFYVCAPLFCTSYCLYLCA